MENTDYEEIYEILDDVNVQIEEIIDEYYNPDTFELMLLKFQQKAQEFIFDFRQEIEK